MNKKIWILLTTLMMTTAVNAETSDFYIGGGLGYEAVPDISGIDGGAALILRGGMKFDQLLQNFSAEVEITKSVLDPEYGNDKQNVLTLATYAAYTINVNDSGFYVRPRFGIILPNLGDSESVHTRDIGFSSGVNGLYKFNDNWGAYVDFTYQGEFINLYSAGVEYNF